MKLLKILTAFIALVSLQIAAAQWLHVPPPVEARGLMMVGGGVPVVAAGCPGTVGETGSSPGSQGTAGDYILCGKFTSSLGCTGTSAKVSIYAHADTSSTAAKMAIYSDAGGSPGSPNVLLGSTAEFNPSGWSTGWNEVTLSGVTITNGATYWICFWNSTAGGTELYYGRETTGGTQAYTSAAYTGTWPDPLVEDASDGVNIYYLHIDVE